MVRHTLKIFNLFEKKKNDLVLNENAAKHPICGIKKHEIVNNK